ncbi:MAG: hypothetical protein ACHQ50_15725, partial [Fimbriimonadales bacterium]
MSNLSDQSFNSLTLQTAKGRDSRAVEASKAPHRVLIGNYLTTAPNGIAFVVGDKAAFCIDTGAPYRAGMAAPDDSCHLIEFAKDGANVVFDWGRVGDAAIGRFRVDKPVRISIKLTQTWPDIKTTYEATDSGAKGSSNGIEWSLKTSPPFAPFASFAVTLPANKPATPT